MLDWERYASAEMLDLFSKDSKYSTWRRLWIALAVAEKSLGLPITNAQIDALKLHIHTIDYKKVADLESIYHHDVMAHLHAYAEMCPEAKPILHLGATSAFVTDNTDVLLIHKGLGILEKKLRSLIHILYDFAKHNASLATLSYTHLQPAQPTTVGKRACLWLQDFIMDFEEILRSKDNLRFLGVKGTTGTGASFLALFDGDADKVQKLEHLVAQEMGFSKTFLISAQTYTRKQDMRTIASLAGLGASAHKCATDIRLLAHMGELQEPFEKKQIGSSAMPYKRNPILSERICALSRFLLSLNQNPGYTLSVQWLERSLDDSANRRLVIPQTFFCADAILELLIKVFKGITVRPKVIKKHLDDELPFMATENILMASAQKGKDRQQVHEKLRQKSMESLQHMQETGLPSDLLTRLENDPDIDLSHQEIKYILENSSFTGLAAQQVEAFLAQEVMPLIQEK